MDNKSIPKWEGVRTSQYKYARYFEQDEPEVLHDMKSDPDEVVNVAKDPKYADVLKTLRRKTDEYVKLYEAARTQPALAR